MDYYKLDSSLSILKAKINENRKLYGYKAKLASASGCQRSFISQVLAGHNLLSPEQALALAQFWNMTSPEQDYFLFLIHFERASTPSLREFYLGKINEARTKSMDLGERFKAKKLPDDDMRTYYSSWVYVAIHMLLTISEYQTPLALSQRLKISVDLVNESLSKLASLGLARRMDQRWLALDSAIHIAKDSPLNALNHSNWRQRAVQDAMLPASQGTHYTAVYSMSRDDAKQLSEMVLGMIDNSRRLVAPSPEEEVYVMLLDYFKV